jgi:hypothetical protein
MRHAPGRLIGRADRKSREAEMLVKQIQAGNVVHNYFGRANPEIEEINGELWIEVDFTVGRDMHDCFQNNEPVIIDGMKYTIEKMESRSGGLAGAFLLSKVAPAT